MLAAFVGVEVISEDLLYSAYSVDVRRQRNPRRDLDRCDSGGRYRSIDADSGVGSIAVILASINSVVGGFVVTDRMLVMFSRPRRSLEKQGRRELER